MLTLLAPAKLNLTLEVLGRRQDGFHEIRSVVQTISLCNTLRFRSSQKTGYISSTPDWIPEKSLVSRAVKTLREATGCSKGVRIEVDKRIPLMSGLGGDSSNAAAVLRGLNKLWELRLSQRELLELAGRLGSDVPFFLHGGTALIEGRGEVVTPLPPLPHMWVVLAVPSVPRQPGKTGQLYASLKASHYTDGRITKRLIERLREGRAWEPSLLFNTFENVAPVHFRGIDVYLKHLTKMGATDVHLAGSGPTLFSLVKDRAQAEDLYVRFQQQGLECYLAETLESS